MSPDLRRGTTNVNVPDEFTPSQVLRLMRLARELRLTDQILSPDLDTVSIVPSGPAPAWTTLDGDHVSFAITRMPFPYSRLDVAVWLGTNAHELGHVLFSPRRQSPLMRRVLESDRMFMPGLAQLHNIVEDQREERLLLGRFSPWRGYLTAALGHHLKADNGSAWLLMTGRTWLPDQVRAEARALFVAAKGESAASEVTVLVGEYQRLVDPGTYDADDAWDVLERLYTLFDLDLPTGGCGGAVMSGGEPDTSEPDEGQMPAAADEAGEPGQDGGSEGEGEAEGNGDGDAEGEGDKPDSQPGAGAGTQPGQPEKFNQRKARERLKAEAKKELDRDEDSKADLDAILDALVYGRAGEGSEGLEPEGENQEATDAARRLHREVSDALLDLKDESEPGWVKRVDSGRLSVRRVLNPRSSSDQWFDRYEPGQMDASELELVLLLDVSVSMHAKLLELGEAAWAIRQAVDDLEGAATVILWDSGPHRVLCQPGERPDDRMFVPHAMGGTEPTSALAEAFRVLADSQARNRLMVVLTDGDWSNYGSQRSEQLIDAMNEAGVTTVLAFMPDFHFQAQVGATVNSHHCRFAERIDQPQGLALLFRKVAAEQIGTWR